MPIDEKNRISILGMKVDMVEIPNVIEAMEGWINKKLFHNYIVVSNADGVMKHKVDIRMRQAVNASSLSVPDGFSLICLGRLKGYSLKRRVYGPDLMSEFIDTTKDKEYSHFFYGGNGVTLDKLLSNLKHKFPDLKIAGYYSPPFRALTPEEDRLVIERINSSNPDVLWVGIGCPKQEIWMLEHKDKLNVPVMVGVGAAFDFLAGTKPQAPTWIRNNGFEWLFRFASEPKRLWRRYLINNSLFVFYVTLELISKAFTLNKNKSN